MDFGRYKRTETNFSERFAYCERNHGVFEMVTGDRNTGLSHRQLEACDLTFADLDRIQAAFLRSLGLPTEPPPVAAARPPPQWELELGGT